MNGGVLSEIYIRRFDTEGFGNLSLGYPSDSCFSHTTLNSSDRVRTYTGSSREVTDTQSLAFT